ncbi:MAG: hypothetical protein V4567_08400 [Pseudomonadota bacterium]
MRYEELPGPLQGWTYDERGVIYTASGYRTTARQIEFCMWMYECMSAEAKRWMIHSDECPGGLRPLYQVADLESGLAANGIVSETANRLNTARRGHRH